MTEMYSLEKLNKTHKKIIELYFTTSLNKIQIAEKVGMNKDTLNKLFNHCELFMEEIKKREAEKNSEIMQFFVRIGENAANKLFDLINCGDPKTEFAAAKEILSRIENSVKTDREYSADKILITLTGGDEAEVKGRENKENND
jgi:hypothetical protein